MQITLDMPQVSKCTVTACAYNIDQACRARAITIGNHDRAQCDTFVAIGSHVQAKQTAGVGACKTTSCIYNQDLECSAGSITVAGVTADADCITYKRR